MDVSLFDYELPPDRIAQEPAESRDASRLLVVDRVRGSWIDARFSDLPRWLRTGDCLVVNESRVISARLLGVLEGEGIKRLDPTRRQWPKTQPIGEALWRAGARGVLAPSAARKVGRVLAIFRTGEAITGVVAVPPSRRFDELPALPPGLRT